MTQGKINVAFSKLCELYRIKGLPFSLSSRLFNMKKRLEPFVEHYTEQEHNLLADRNALNADGTIRQDMPQDEVIAINMELFDMRATEVEWNGEPLTIQLTDELADKLGVTGELMEQLDGIVTVEGVEE